ncbi:Uncharacterized protein FWK35_00012777, partial [Aphis craccivora]
MNDSNDNNILKSPNKTDCSLISQFTVSIITDIEGVNDLNIMSLIDQNTPKIHAVSQTKNKVPKNFLILEIVVDIASCIALRSTSPKCYKYMYLRDRLSTSSIVNFKNLRAKIVLEP